jgi:hypothetical protein
MRSEGFADDIVLTGYSISLPTKNKGLSTQDTAQLQLLTITYDFLGAAVYRNAAFNLSFEQNPNSLMMRLVLEANAHICSPLFNF